LNLSPSRLRLTSQFRTFSHDGTPTSKQPPKREKVYAT
jgi:hypothetical protein